MKVVLARPNYFSLYQLIKSKTKYQSAIVPLGLLYVASALEGAGHQVVVIDGAVDDLTPDDLVRRIENSHPDIVGVGATTVDFDDANQALREVKERLKVVTLLGGVHATVLPDQVLHENPHIDYLVRGEGEITTRELLKKLGQKGNISKVEGISYREGLRIVHNPDRPFIPNLDENCLPARHLIDQSKYLSPLPGGGMRRRRTAIQTQRGCPFKCIYCYHMFGNRVRFRDPALVVDEIEDCINKYGVEYVTFMDDTFMIDPNRVFKLCEEIARRKLKFFWYCFTRADTIREDLLRKMKGVGCNQITVGVESGNQGILDIAGKGVKLEQYVKAYELLEAVGFEKRGSFILGLPYENAKTLRDTIDFAKKLKLDRAFFNISTPYPGTRMFEMAVRGEGLCLTTEAWKEYKRWGNAVIELVGINGEALKEWQKVAMMEFYARPRVILRHLKAFISGGREKFYYRPLLFGLKEYYNRKIKSLGRRSN